MNICPECYSSNNRKTPLLHPHVCLQKHTQYICGTCGWCICIEKDPKRNLQRWHFPFSTLEKAILYLRSAQYTTKSDCVIYKITNKNHRTSYKIFHHNRAASAYQNNNKKILEFTCVFVGNLYKEYPHTQVRKLNNEEVMQYLNEQKQNI